MHQPEQPNIKMMCSWANDCLHMRDRLLLPRQPSVAWTVCTLSDKPPCASDDVERGGATHLAAETACQLNQTCSSNLRFLRVGPQASSQLPQACPAAAQHPAHRRRCRPWPPRLTPSRPIAVQPTVFHSCYPPPSQRSRTMRPIAALLIVAVLRPSLAVFGKVQPAAGC